MKQIKKVGKKYKTKSGLKVVITHIEPGVSATGDLFPDPTDLKRKVSRRWNIDGTFAMNEPSLDLKMGIFK